jgi:tetratricopeptide (TPR) repeat protein
MHLSSAIAASEFNNKGLYLLENGLYSQAVIAFSQGVVIVKQVLAEEEEEDASFDSAMAQACSESPPMPECFFHQQQNSQLTSDYTHDTLLYEEPFLFKAPIYIQSTPDTIASGFAATTKYFIKLSFILLYNLALAHHLRAATEPKSKTKRLQKAMKLYEIAFTMQLQDLDLSVLQVMAISNNLGHIHTILRNETKSRRCFEHLLQSILLCQHPQEEDEPAVPLDGFLTNVMPFMLNGLASAPAA